MFYREAWCPYWNLCGPVPFSAWGAPPLIDRRALRQSRPENPNVIDEFPEER